MDCVRMSDEAGGEVKRIVILPGLFGASVSSAVVKEMQDRAPDRCKVVALHPGPVSSIHDRAVECFYMLKGGRVGQFFFFFSSSFSLLLWP